MAEAVNQSEGRWKNQKEDGKRGCDQARCGDKRDGGGCQDVRDGETEVIRSNLSTKRLTHYCNITVMRKSGYC